MQTSTKKSISVVTLVTAGFVVLTVGSIGTLLHPLLDAWTGYDRAQNAVELARADEALLLARSELRVNRGQIQTLLVSEDNVLDKFTALHNKNSELVTSVMGAIRPILKGREADQLNAINAAVADEDRMFKAAVLSQTEKPLASRDLKATMPWYEGVGTVVTALGVVSDRVATMARMTDAELGELAQVRQSAWATREAAGDECTIARPNFAQHKPLDGAGWLRVGATRGAARQSAQSIGLLVNRPGAPAAVATGYTAALSALQANFGARDKLLQSIGQPGEASNTEWTSVCNDAFGPWVDLAKTAIGGMKDRAQAELRSAWWQLGVNGGLMLLDLAVTAALMVFVVRGAMVRPVRTLSAAIGRLAQNDYDTPVPAMPRADEFGRMAETIEQLRQSAATAQRMHQDRLAEQEARAARAMELDRLVKEFQTQASELVSGLAQAATELEYTAGSLSGTASEATEQASAVAGAAQDAGMGVQNVAAAAEELSASIAEISRQVSHSARMTVDAVTHVQRTDEIVHALSTSATKIGDVVSIISHIAGQTNLLALNATIEAARAGEAGKGFAVVASEVKSLADQTSKATQQIATQISAIQGSTREAVQAIGEISTTIDQVSTISSAIAAAVEEQGAATVDIARNVQDTAQNTKSVTSSIGVVSEGARGTGSAAAALLGSAQAMARQASDLAGAITSFTAGVQAI